jgi:DNA-binding transcriptional LysR family regulator
MQKLNIMIRRLMEGLPRYELLQAVAQLGSVSSAARRLHLSQPAASHALKTLERRLGVPLTARRARGVELTPAGQVLAELGRDVGAAVERSAARLALGDDAPRTFRAGTHEAMAVHVWPAVLARVARAHDGLRILLVSGRIDQLVERLHQGGLDFLISVAPRRHRELAIQPLFDGVYGFYEAASPGRRAPARTTLAALRERPLLTDAGGHSRQGVSIPEALFENGLPPSGPFEVASFDAAINLAAEGLGVAVVPDRNAAPAVAAGRLRALRVKGLRRPALLTYTVCATRRANEPVSTAQQAVTRYLIGGRG